MYIYGRHRQIKTGVSLFGPPCIRCRLIANAKQAVISRSLRALAVLRDSPTQRQRCANNFRKYGEQGAVTDHDTND